MTARADTKTAAPIAAGLLLVTGIGIYAWRKRKAAPTIEGPSVAPYPSADASGPLGQQVRAAQDAGWDVLFATSEYAHKLPLGLLWAVASRETMMKDIVGDFGHGRGLMQVDDRS